MEERGKQSGVSFSARWEITPERNKRLVTEQITDGERPAAWEKYEHLLPRVLALDAQAKRNDLTPSYNLWKAQTGEEPEELAVEETRPLGPLTLRSRYKPVEIKEKVVNSLMRDMTTGRFVRSKDFESYKSQKKRTPLQELLAEALISPPIYSPSKRVSFIQRAVENVRKIIDPVGAELEIMGKATGDPVEGKVVDWVKNHFRAVKNSVKGLRGKVRDRAYRDGLQERLGLDPDDPVLYALAEIANNEQVDSDRRQGLVSGLMAGVALGAPFLGTACAPEVSVNRLWQEVTSLMGQQTPEPTKVTAEIPQLELTTRTFPDFDILFGNKSSLRGISAYQVAQYLLLNDPVLRILSIGEGQFDPFHGKTATGIHHRDIFEELIEIHPQYEVLLRAHETAERTINQLGPNTDFIPHTGSNGQPTVFLGIEGQARNNFFDSVLRGEPIPPEALTFEEIKFGEQNPLTEPPNLLDMAYERGAKFMDWELDGGEVYGGGKDTYEAIRNQDAILRNLGAEDREAKTRFTTFTSGWVQVVRANNPPDTFSSENDPRTNDSFLAPDEKSSESLYQRVRPVINLIDIDRGLWYW